MLPMPPPITQALLLINVAAFCLDLILDRQLRTWFALYPLGTGFMPWQLVSYAFLHGSWLHLFLNMLGLWVFGSELESNWGRKRYLHLLAAGIFTAALAQLLLAPVFGSRAATIGASGAVFALLTGYAMTFPQRVVMLLIPPIPIKARTLALVYGGFELFMLLPSWVPGVDLFSYLIGNVAHLAHLGGMLGAFLIFRFWRRQPPFRRR